MENYETLGTIGESTYGVVLKARHKETGQVVAIKKFKESDEDEQVRKTALREVRILKQLKHDNIVTLIEVFRRKGKLHLVFEFVERTILEDLERNPDGMHPIEAKKCLWQLLRSIEYCHAHNVIHRDIKPENLLISKNGTLKLCDFGFARTLAGPGARYTDYVATRWYRGPELLTGETQYGKPVDVWAIGCMLPEMASGAPLFPGESDIDQLFHIMRCFGQLPPNLLDVFKSNPLFNGIKIPESLSATETLDRRFPQYGRELLSFMKSCLRYEPEHRATCGELMEHEYFTEDGFVAWFEGELKQMLDRDAADFKMRQKKYRKSMRSRGGDPNAEHRQARAPPPPPPQQAQHHHAPPPAPSIPPPPPQERAHAPAAAPSLPSHLGSSLHHRGAPELSREALQPLSLGGTYHHPPPPELPAEIAERRPATRGEGGGRRDEKEAPNDLGGARIWAAGCSPTSTGRRRRAPRGSSRSRTSRRRSTRPSRRRCRCRSRTRRAGATRPPTSAAASTRSRRRRPASRSSTTTRCPRCPSSAPAAATPPATTTAARRTCRSCARARPSSRAAASAAAASAAASAARGSAAAAPARRPEPVARRREEEGVGVRLEQPVLVVVGVRQAAVEVEGEVEGGRRRRRRLVVAEQPRRRRRDGARRHGRLRPGAGDLRPPRRLLAAAQPADAGRRVRRRRRRLRAVVAHRPRLLRRRRRPLRRRPRRRRRHLGLRPAARQPPGGAVGAPGSTGGGTRRVLPFVAPRRARSGMSTLELLERRATLSCVRPSDFRLGDRSSATQLRESARVYGTPRLSGNTRPPALPEAVGRAGAWQLDFNDPGDNSFVVEGQPVERGGGRSTCRARRRPRRRRRRLSAARRAGGGARSSWRARRRSSRAATSRACARASAQAARGRGLNRPERERSAPRDRAGRFAVLEWEASAKQQAAKKRRQMQDAATPSPAVAPPPAEEEAEEVEDGTRRGGGMPASAVVDLEGAGGSGDDDDEVALRRRRPSARRLGSEVGAAEGAGGGEG